MTEYSIESGETLADAPDHTEGTLAMVPAGDQFAHLPLAVIVPSLTNPRKSFDAGKLAELAESVKASGVHQPILVRPLPGSRLEETSLKPLHPQQAWPFPLAQKKTKAERPTHEIVAGERRYRAALLAGLATVPAMIRAMTDEQVLECQLVENLQRDDLSALEEAEGYEHLCAATGISKDDVGGKIGKSRSYVYSSLKLLDLSQECKQALREGKIDKSRALLIARIPDGKLQLKALAYATEIESYSHEQHSVRGLKEWLQKNVMLKLEHAVFKLNDARLVEAAGSCTDCPKRTGANPDLFSDVDGADICTDPACYHGKKDAHRAALIKRAEAKGMRIVEGKEALEMMDGRQHMIMPDNYASLTQKRPDLTPEGERPATLRELLGKDAPGAILFIHPRTQEVMELVPDDEAEAVLLAKGLVAKEEQRANRLEDLDADLARLQKRAKVETAQAYSDAVSTAAIKAIRATNPEQARTLLSPEALRAWLLNDLDDLGEDHMADVLGYEFQEGEDEVAAITGHIQRMGDTELYRAGALNILDRETCMRPCDDGLGPVLEAFVKGLGLDTKPLQRAATNKVKGEYGQRIRELQALIDAKKQPLPLASAAQAKGGGGAEAQSQKAKSPAAPARKRKMSAPEAQAAIAAAMQGQDTDTGAADASQGIDASLDPGSGCALPVGAPDDAFAAEALILHGRALALIISEQKASVRRLKTGLGIGTDKAMELLDALERAGKVSAIDQGGNRKVLVLA
jgi:ParB/RepB/Spo0J family partition protein